MWFQISFFPDRPDLLAAVASDGNVYWNAESVAKFLGYRHAKYFPQRYAKRNLNDLIPAFAAHHDPIPIFTFKEMIETMKTVKKSFQKVDRLVTLWSKGLINVSDAAPTVTPGNCPRLVVVLEHGKGIPIQEWIRQYTRDCLKNFTRLLEQENILKAERKSASEKVKEEEKLISQSTRDANVQTNKESPMDVEYWENDVLTMASSVEEPLNLSTRAIYPNPAAQLDVGDNTVPEEIYLSLNGKVYSYINLDSLSV